MLETQTASRATLGVISADLQARVTVLRKSGEGQTVDLNRPVTIFGSHKDAKVRLKHPSVAPAHCAIINTGTRLILRDLASRSGTVLNDRPVNDAELKTDDVFCVDAWRFRVSAHPRKPGDSCSGSSFAATQFCAPTSLILEKCDGSRTWDSLPELLVIGRRKTCEVHLEGTDVSRAHALVCVFHGRVAIFDLFSANSLRVNGRTTAMVFLKPGDVLSVGDHELRVRDVQNAGGRMDLQESCYMFEGFGDPNIRLAPRQEGSSAEFMRLAASPSRLNGHATPSFDLRGFTSPDPDAAGRDAALAEKHRRLLERIAELDERERYLNERNAEQEAAHRLLEARELEVGDKELLLQSAAQRLLDSHNAQIAKATEEAQHLAEQRHAELQAREQECLELRSRLESARTDAEGFRQGLETARSGQLNLDEETQKLTDALAEACGTIEARSAMLDQREAEVDVLRGERAQAQAAAAELSRQLAEAVESARRQSEVSAREIREREADRQNHQNAAAGRAREIEAVRQELEAARRELLEQADGLAERQERLEAARCELQSVREAADEFRRQVEAASSDSARSAALLAQYTEAAAEAGRVLRDKQKTIGQLESQVDGLHQEVTQLQTRLVVSERHAEVQSAAVLQLQGVLAEREAALTQAQAELAKAREQSADADRRLDVAQAQIGRARADARELAEQLAETRADAQQRLDRAQQTVDGLQTALTARQAALEARVAEVRQARDTAAAAEASTEQMRARLATQEQAFGNQTAQLSTLLEARGADLSDTQAALAETCTELASAHGCIAELQRQVEALSADTERGLDAIARRLRELEAREQGVRQHESAVTSEREALVAQKATVREREAFLGAREQEISDRADQLAEAHAGVEASRQEVARQEADVRNLESVLIVKQADLDRAWQQVESRERETYELAAHVDEQALAARDRGAELDRRSSELTQTEVQQRETAQRLQIDRSELNRRRTDLEAAGGRLAEQQKELEAQRLRLAGQEKHLVGRRPVGSGDGLGTRILDLSDVEAKLAGRESALAEMAKSLEIKAMELDTAERRLKTREPVLNELAKSLEMRAAELDARQEKMHKLRAEAEETLRQCREREATLNGREEGIGKQQVLLQQIADPLSVSDERAFEMLRALSPDLGDSVRVLRRLGVEGSFDQLVAQAQRELDARKTEKKSKPRWNPFK